MQVTPQDDLAWTQCNCRCMNVMNFIHMLIVLCVASVTLALQTHGTLLESIKLTLLLLILDLLKDSSRSVSHAPHLQEG